MWREELTAKESQMPIGEALDYMAEKNGAARNERHSAPAPDTRDRRPEAVRLEHRRRCTIMSDARDVAREAATLARMWLGAGRGTEAACVELDAVAAEAQAAYNAELTACYEELK